MKYFNKKTVIDGITFDSQKEGERYLQLKALERAGEIYDLELQKVFKYEGISGKVLFKYICDFSYYKKGEVLPTIEDVKSPYTAKLPLFRLKKKLIEDLFPSKIDIIY